MHGSGPWTNEQVPNINGCDTRLCDKLGSRSQSIKALTRLLLMVGIRYTLPHYSLNYLTWSKSQSLEEPPTSAVTSSRRSSRRRSTPSLCCLAPPATPGSKLWGHRSLQSITPTTPLSLLPSQAYTPSSPPYPSSTPPRSSCCSTPPSRPA